MPRMIVTATIPAGQSLSSAIDLSQGTAQFIHMPVDWTPANMSFQLSPDNVTFSDVVDENGREIVATVLGNTTIRLMNFQSVAYGYLKVRSGSRDYPIPQAAQRGITISGFT